MKSITRTASCIAFAAAVMLTTALGTYAQNERSTISGFVFGPDRRPVSQVFVELVNDYGMVVRRVRTDGSGRYFFSGLGHGRYRVKALPFGTGMEEGSAEVEIAGVGISGRQLSDNVQQDIYLRLRKNADSIPFQNAVVYAQDVPKRAEDLYKSAINDMDRGRVDPAVTQLEQAIAIFPDYFMALQRLGVIRIAQNKLEEAAKLFQRALDVNARSFDSTYGLAYSLYGLQRSEEALPLSEKAVSLKPDSVEANLLLGIIRRHAKDYTNAEAAFKKAERSADGTSADVHWNLALLYAHNMERYADAAKELEKYLEIARDIPNKDEVKKVIKHYKEKAREARN